MFYRHQFSRTKSPKCQKSLTLPPKLNFTNVIPEYFIQTYGCKICHILFVEYIIAHIIRIHWAPRMSAMRLKMSSLNIWHGMRITGTHRRSDFDTVQATHRISVRNRVCCDHRNTFGRQTYIWSYNFLLELEILYQKKLFGRGQERPIFPNS